MHHNRAPSSETSSETYVCEVVRSVRDMNAGRRRRFLYNIPIPHGQGFFPFSIPPSELPETVKARVPSPSGDKILILREETNGENDSKDPSYSFEVWSRGAEVLSHRILIPKKLHGRVINDPNGFGGLRWHNDETAVVYSAERLSPETASFFDAETDDQTDKVVGGQFTLGVGIVETWGEKYSKQSALTELFILNIHTQRFARIQNVPLLGDNITTNGGFTLGQVRFSPCGTHVVYTAWDAGGGSEMPRRLGMVYCFNRPSKIYASPVDCLLKRLSASLPDDSLVEEDGPCLCLTSTCRFSRSPRFSQPANGLSRLCFLSSKDGFDTHNGGMELHAMDWNVSEAMPMFENYKVLVETVLDPPPLDQNNNVQVANMSFPGLYVGQLPDHCCIGDYLLTTTQWGSVEKVVRISLKDGSVSLLRVDILRTNGLSSDPLASQRLLCVTAEGGALVSESAPNRPTIVGFVSPSSLLRDTLPGKVEATLVAEMGPFASSSICPVTESDVASLLTFSYDVLTIKPPEIEEQEVGSLVQWILLRPKLPKDSPPPPLIVVPHGGPHSCTSTAYNPAIAFLCAKGGYSILLVNYRGSLGFGQRALESLPGNIGVLDVKDVVDAAVKISDSGWVDGERIGICGGSHGGFLASHCIGQFPDLFKVAALRNPVTNVASMVTATDIPDWCYTEGIGCGHYNFKRFRGPNKDELTYMFDASPIKHVSNVIAPTLVALGMSDKRVPPSQGLEFFYTLRSQGVVTKLLQYEDDDHAIDKVRSEADHWINIKRFFDDNL